MTRWEPTARDMFDAPLVFVNEKIMCALVPGPTEFFQTMTSAAFSDAVCTAHANRAKAWSMSETMPDEFRAVAASHGAGYVFAFGERWVATWEHRK